MAWRFPAWGLAMACGLAMVGEAVALRARTPRLDAGARAAATHTVTIDATSYRPARLVVASGDTVVWVNEDVIPHTATAAGGAFDSEVVAPGRAWRYTVKRAGGYDYACTFHPTMRGRLEVR